MHMNLFNFTQHTIR